MDYKRYGSTPLPVVSVKTVDIRDIHMVHAEGKRLAATPAFNIEGMEETIRPTRRFFDSMLSTYGMAGSMFNLFTYEEVFDRLVERERGSKVSISLQENTNGSKTALAMTRPGKNTVSVEALDRVFRNLDAFPDKIEYVADSGVVRSVHTPSVLGRTSLKINGDDTSRKFVLDVPIDGFGAVSSFLMMLRQVCLNGMVALAPAFRHTFTLGNMNGTEVIPSLSNFINSHNDEEGFSAYTSRLQTAAKTPCSLDEAYRLYLMLGKTALINNEQTRVLTSFNTMVGPQLLASLGAVSMEHLPAKKRRIINTECTVGDLINFASEVGTHKANSNDQRKYDGFIGTLIANEFDLEGMDAKSNKLSDFYIQ